ncbi:MAG TPA: hypothetical protein VKV73_03005 [Chloroflexota bacterium]|nr:hypothetical protein [Chloroflexota bacterium]
MTTRSGPLSTADVAAAAEQRRSDRTDAAFDADVHAAVERKPADRAESDHQRTPLFAANEAEQLHRNWSDIQAGFVDEPRRAVEQADGLVADVMQRLATAFANERQALEQQWDRGGDTDTEALRQALQRYRSFFDRLLAL